MKTSLTIMSVALIILLGVSSCLAAESDVDNFISTIDLCNKATVLTNRLAPGVLKKEDLKTILQYYKQAYQCSLRVDVAFLEKKYKGWGENFKILIDSLKNRIEGLEESDLKKSIIAQEYSDKWADWFSVHVKYIRKIKSY